MDKNRREMEAERDIITALLVMPEWAWYCEHVLDERMTTYIANVMSGEGDNVMEGRAMYQALKEAKEAPEIILDAIKRNLADSA